MKDEGWRLISIHFNLRRISCILPQLLIGGLLFLAVKSTTELPVFIDHWWSWLEQRASTEEKISERSFQKGRKEGEVLVTYVASFRKLFLEKSSSDEELSKLGTIFGRLLQTINEATKKLSRTSWPGLCRPADLEARLLIWRPRVSERAYLHRV